MALNTKAKAEPQDDTILLELALYTNYMRGDVTYVKGQRYRFKRNDAIMLLQENDFGRPIWKIWREPKPQPRKAEVIDVTKAVIAPLAEPIPGTEPEQRIDVGDDSEIAELLSDPDNVTV